MFSRLLRTVAEVTDPATLADLNAARTRADLVDPATLADFTKPRTVADVTFPHTNPGVPSGETGRETTSVMMIESTQ